MTVYVYYCTACERRFEVEQKMGSDPVGECALCAAQGSVRRIILGAGVVYKAYGFYSTDSAKGDGQDE